MNIILALIFYQIYKLCSDWKYFLFMLLINDTGQVMYTGLRILKSGVTLNHFTVECMIRDHYMPYQVTKPKIEHARMFITLFLSSFSLLNYVMYRAVSDVHRHFFVANFCEELSLRHTFYNSKISFMLNKIMTNNS